MRILGIILILLAQISTYPPDYGDMSKQGKGKGRPPGVTPGPPTSYCGRSPNEQPGKWCFSYDSILYNIAVFNCSVALTPTCSINPAASSYLMLVCDPGGMPPPEVIGIYVVDAVDSDCSGYDYLHDPGWTADSLNQKQKDACVSALLETGYCS